MTLNPYEELNLPKTATTVEVKAAYRRKAKKAHPDAGGTAESFNRLSRAMLILSDSARRQKYDSTGDIDEATPDNAVAVALSIIVGFVAQVISQHVSQNAPDPCGLDLVDLARRHFIKQALLLLDGYDFEPDRTVQPASPIHGRSALFWSITS